jgi:hypothetical protein
MFARETVLINFNISPSLHTVSNAVDRSTNTTPVFSWHWKLASMCVVSPITCSVQLRCLRCPTWWTGVAASIRDSMRWSIIRSSNLYITLSNEIRIKLICFLGVAFLSLFVNELRRPFLDSLSFCSSKNYKRYFFDVGSLEKIFFEIVSYLYFTTIFKFWIIFHQIKLFLARKTR